MDGRPEGIPMSNTGLHITGGNPEMREVLSEEDAKKYYLILYKIILGLTILFLILSFGAYEKLNMDVFLKILVYIIMVSSFLLLLFLVVGIKPNGKDINKLRANLLFIFVLTSVGYLMVITARPLIVPVISFGIIALYVFSLPYQYRYFSRPKPYKSNLGRN